jgi:uncharacterized protein (DUF1778 family)
MSAFETSPADLSLVFPLNREQKQLLEEAAKVRGQSVSEFVLSNVLPVAQETIDHGQSTRLSARDLERFLTLLDVPPEPNDELCQAANRYRERSG